MGERGSAKKRPKVKGGWGFKRLTVQVNVKAKNQGRDIKCQKNISVDDLKRWWCSSWINSLLSGLGNLITTEIALILADVNQATTSWWWQATYDLNRQAGMKMLNMQPNAQLWSITLIHLRAQCLVGLFSIIWLETMKRPDYCHESWSNRRRWKFGKARQLS